MSDGTTIPPKEPVSFAVYQHPRYAHHLNAATMLRKKNELRGLSEASLYIDLCVYALDGLMAESFDAQDFLCRLLACFKSQGQVLPTLTHVQSIMALLWDTDMPPDRRDDLQVVSTALFHFLYEEFSHQFMLTMQSFGAALHTPVDLEMSNEAGEVIDTTKPRPEQPDPDSPSATQAQPADPKEWGKPTLH